MRRLGMFVLASIMIAANPVGLRSQCTVGTNQPDRVAFTGNPSGWVAFPKKGARIYNSNNGQWQTAPGSGIRYAYCNGAPPFTSNCARGIGDMNFTTAQKNAMDLSFSNWGSSSVSNGSGLGYDKVSSLGLWDLWSIEVWRVSDTGTARGIVHFFSAWADYNGDGIADQARVGASWVEMKGNMSTTTMHTKVLSHEIGHTMGLEDCATCNIQTTVMLENPFVSEANLLSGPSTCDNQQVSTMMQ